MHFAISHLCTVILDLQHSAQLSVISPETFLNNSQNLHFQVLCLSVPEGQDCTLFALASAAASTVSPMRVLNKLQSNSTDSSPLLRAWGSILSSKGTDRYEAQPVCLGSLA